MTTLDPTVRSLPHFVYRAYDADGGCLYVGCTVDPLRRMAEHSGPWSIWWERTARIEWDSYDNYDTGRLAEAIAIAEHRPRFNKVRPQPRRLRTSWYPDDVGRATVKDVA